MVGGVRGAASRGAALSRFCAPSSHATTSKILSLTSRKTHGISRTTFNEKDQVLLVQPTYKESWELPGGVIELDESPKGALIREVKEELNLQLEPQNIKFLLLDYMAGNGYITEALMFIFSGGLLSEEQRKSIRLPEDELKSYKFA